jgi:hypothetical protein
VVWASAALRSPKPDAWIDFILAATGVIGEVAIILVKAKSKKLSVFFGKTE